MYLDHIYIVDFLMGITSSPGIDVGATVELNMPTIGLLVDIRRHFQLRTFQLASMLFVLPSTFCCLCALPDHHMVIYTVSHKKRGSLFLTITSANFNRFL